MASPVEAGVDVTSVGWAVAVLLAVEVGERGGLKGVPVAVGVKVGKGVEVLAGREVDTPAVRPKLARRQACKKASRPMKPAPRIKCLLSIYLYLVDGRQQVVDGAEDPVYCLPFPVYLPQILKIHWRGEILPAGGEADKSLVSFCSWAYTGQPRCLNGQTSQCRPGLAITWLRARA